MSTPFCRLPAVCVPLDRHLALSFTRALYSVQRTAVFFTNKSDEVVISWEEKRAREKTHILSACGIISYIGRLPTPYVSFDCR